MASSFPSLTILQLIWKALHDKDPSCRSAASAALSACLKVITTRGELSRNQHQTWFRLIWEEILRGAESKDNDVVIGSLFALNSLLQHGSFFVQNKHAKAMNIVLSRTKSSSKSIRKAAVGLLPALAKCDTNAFVINHLHNVMKELIATLKKNPGGERNYIYPAIGELALCLGHHFQPFVAEVISVIHAGLKVQRNIFWPESLICIRMMIQGLGVTFLPHIENLLPLLFASGLTTHMIEVLSALVVISPPAKAVNIQLELLGLFSQVQIDFLYADPLLDIGEPTFCKTRNEAKTFQFSYSYLF